ncbi:MAG: M23 family metallopeptidase [Miltoncostaeaceae bacterium]
MTTATTTTRLVPLRTLRSGSRGEYVKDLQSALRKRGIRVAVDGMYGAGTRRGVKIVQKRLKLRSTGIAKTGFQRRMGLRPRKLTVKVSTLAFVAPTDLRLVRPVGGEITSGFGPRGGRLHAGIDIPGKLSTPIRAAAAGKVARVGWGSGYGNIVVVDHGNGVRTAYAHLNNFAVEKGQLVAQGTELGGMGTTGSSSAIHLHFELRFKGRAVNPVPFLSKPSR